MALMAVRKGYQPVKNNDNPHLKGNLDPNDPPGRTSMAKAEFNASKLAKQMTVNIKIKGVKKFLARVFIARYIFRLGAMILGSNIVIEENNG